MKIAMYAEIIASVKSNSPKVTRTKSFISCPFIYAPNIIAAQPLNKRTSRKNPPKKTAIAIPAKVRKRTANTLADHTAMSPFNWRLTV